MFPGAVLPAGSIIDTVATVGAEKSLATTTTRASHCAPETPAAIVAARPKSVTFGCDTASDRFSSTDTVSPMVHTVAEALFTVNEYDTTAGGVVSAVKPTLNNGQRRKVYRR